MFLLYHSEGCNICGMEFHKCYINDLRTTTCSGILGHRTTSPTSPLTAPSKTSPDAITDLTNLQAKGGQFYQRTPWLPRTKQRADRNERQEGGGIDADGIDEEN
jgi:hypothetical protein